MMLSIFIWGTGNVAKMMLSQCLNLDQYRIIGFIDNDYKKVGTTFNRYPVFAPSILLTEDFDKIIIMSDFYLEIKEQIIGINESLEKKIENKYFFIKQSLLKRYRTTDNKEIGHIVDWVEEHGLDVFNYDFVEKYSSEYVDIGFDEEEKLFFVNHFGKKMYFPRKFEKKEDIRKYYNSIRVEQDIDSPHRYFDDKVQVHEGDIVVDVGVAEGNFALDIIDIAKKIYLIEADDDWFDALKLTFKDYSEKVVFVKGYLTSYDDGKLVKLDSIIDEPIDFIKMDIEGAEYDALCGASHLIDLSDNVRLSICSYHSDYDQILIEHFMDEHNIEHYSSKGYMWFPYTVKQNAISTKLVKGIIRGIK